MTIPEPILQEIDRLLGLKDDEAIHEKTTIVIGMIQDVSGWENADECLYLLGYIAYGH